MEMSHSNKKADDLQPVMQVISHSPLQKLVDKARLLLALNRFVQAWLPPEWVSHCRVMNLDLQTLVLGTDNAALATRIQFMSSDLISVLKKEKSFPVISAVRCRVRLISSEQG